jgi:hypothetical protein
MIRLNKTSTGTQSNTIKLSLNSKRLYDSSITSYFFIKVVNDMTKDEQFAYPTVASTTSRYVTFTFTMVDSGASASQLRFTHEGYHTYTMYNIRLNDLTSDDTLTSADICEQGKLYFNTTLQEEVTYTQYTPLAENNDNILNNNTVYLKI